eukprot:TRINITY_DN4085_c0_g1_i2.p1 TRINITY_DN4085_c0_g1~~TRINITY_DN4085_c0_g1_i2.p1  ORF type:complete len:520 (+),score=117.68 TRINITY_DN4085_c0_g1_i2:93-1562(+)
MCIRDRFYTKLAFVGDFVEEAIKKMLERRVGISSHEASEGGINYLVDLTLALNRVIAFMFERIYKFREEDVDYAICYRRAPTAKWTQSEPLLTHIYSLLEINYQLFTRQKLKLEEATKKNFVFIARIFLVETTYQVRYLRENMEEINAKQASVINLLFELGLYKEASDIAISCELRGIVCRIYCEHSEKHKQDLISLFNRWKEPCFLHEFIDYYISYQISQFESVDQDQANSKEPFRLFLEFEEITEDIANYVSKTYPELFWLISFKENLPQSKSVLSNSLIDEARLHNRMMIACAGAMASDRFGTALRPADYVNLAMVTEERKEDSEFYQEIVCDELTTKYLHWDKRYRLEDAVDELLGAEDEPSKANRVSMALRYILNSRRVEQATAEHLVHFFNCYYEKEREEIDHLAKIIEIIREEEDAEKKLRLVPLWSNWDLVEQVANALGCDLYDSVNKLQDNFKSVLQRMISTKRNVVPRSPESFSMRETS